MPYAPAGNLTTSVGITHLPAAYYKNRGQDKLKQKFRFLPLTEPDDLPRRSGKTVQFFRYDLFAANTTPSSEGVVGTSLAQVNSTMTATVEEYSDFITVSSLLDMVAPDPQAEEAVDGLSYRAGLTVDTLVRTEFDSGTTALATMGATFAGADAARVVALLEGANVMPRDGDTYMGVIHPYVAFDLMTDNTAGGFLDVAKYAEPNRMVMGEIGKINNVRFVMSTNVATSGTAPNVLYSTYIVGKGGIGAVSLAGKGPSKIQDPTRQQFSVNVIPGKPQIADPEGKIGFAVSYYFVFTTLLLGTDDPRYRIVDADVSMV